MAAKTLDPAIVISNALDFIAHAAHVFWDTALTEERQLKFSTIELFEGIELLVKARLMEEHWALVVDRLDDTKRARIETGDFVSVGYDKARQRLVEVCGIDVPERAHTAFEQLKKLRNQYVHYAGTQPRVAVLAIQLQAWHHVLDLLGTSWEFMLDATAETMLATVRQSMLRSEEFLATRFKELQERLEAIRDDGKLVANCPTCGLQGLIIGDAEFSCMVCETVQTSWSHELADTYARATDFHWKHPKHGIDDDVAWCGECDAQAAVPAGQELASQIEAVFKRAGVTLYDDSRLFICFSCGEPSDGRGAEVCDYCGAVCLGDRSGSQCPACERGRFW